ncbi:FxLYD domain-containing protein [Halostagnicola bangensis]
MAPNSPSRRTVLTAGGTVTAAILAGCNGIDIGDEPDYEAGDVGDIDGEERTAEEMTAAEGVAEQEVTGGVTPLEGIALADHEFVLEDGYLGSTVQGTVENTGSDRIELVEVRVRVYDETGTQIDRYLDTTGDLSSGSEWEFQVVILEAPEDIADYDIVVLGTPA